MPKLAVESSDNDVLSWVRAKVTEGVALLKKERAYNDVNTCIDYINGEQFPLRSRAISNLVDNRIRKIAFEIASALTDIRPIWNYEANNIKYAEHGEILNKLARAWWKYSRTDRKLYSAILYSLVGGTGYLYLYWNPNLPGGGDIDVVTFDPRNVIPVEPTYTESAQDWRGVILRQRLAIETVKDMYPLKANKIGAAAYSNWFGPEGTKNKVYDVVTTVWSIIKGRSRWNEDELPGSVDLVRVFVKDDSIHTGSEPKLMGEPDSNWSYVVYPVGSKFPEGHSKAGQIVSREEAKLYPRGRLIICTPEVILEDIPNPYWHGYFPIIKICLDPMPWSILGASLISDLLPLQNALNEGIRGTEDAMSQWIRRGVIADARAISPENLKQIDTRKAGLRAHLNPVGGEGFKIIEGPQLPDWYMKMLEFLKNEIDENSGIKEFRAYSAAKSNPNEDDFDKMQDAFSPLLRGRSGALEVAFGEMAEMLKVNFFQFYTGERRMQILGENGITVEDFDYDPNTLVPADLPGNTTEERAQEHHRSFHFSIAQGSLLNISHTMQRMLVLQAFKSNAIDIYSVWKAMDLPDIGQTPAETIPERMVAARKMGLQPGPTPELIEAQLALAVGQAKAQLQQLQMQQAQMQQQMAMGQIAQLVNGGQGGAPGQGGPQGPPGGQEGGPLAPPPTSGVGPQGGRPSTGQEPPQLVTKDNGMRTIVSESGE